MPPADPAGIGLNGRIVRLLPEAPRAVVEGCLFLSGAGRVVDVRDSDDPPPGLEAAPVVDLGDSFVCPGLINLHSHLGYNALPLWAEPGERKPFLHHDIWPSRPSYKPKVSWPAWVLAKAAPEALLAYVQVQALAGGTTTIQGWPSVNRQPANRLLRSADDERFAGGDDRVRTSTLTLDVHELLARAEDLQAGRGFIYHCAEGQRDSRVVEEFADLGTANCLRQRLIAIHCTALGAADFAKWKDRADLAGDAEPAGTVVWSPFSNLWLYGQTTDVPGARDAGLAVCLGSDWGPSGTRNLLGELKVARLWAEKEGWPLDDFDLVEMVTGNPGDALGRCWGVQAGRLPNGACADVTVLAPTRDDPFEALVAAREKDIRLVVVDGRPRYGTKALMDACGAGRTTSVTVGSSRFRTVLTDPGEPGKPWVWSRVLEALEAVRADPLGTVATADAPTAAEGRIPSAVGPEGNTLVVELDMPGAPGMSAGPPPPGVIVDFDPIPSLAHDRGWRASLKGRGFHDGLLDGLDRFYAP